MFKSGMQTIYLDGYSDLFMLFKRKHFHFLLSVERFECSIREQNVSDFNVIKRFNQSMVIIYV